MDCFYNSSGVISCRSGSFLVASQEIIRNGRGGGGEIKGAREPAAGPGHG